jgi:hypothetical protein
MGEKSMSIGIPHDLTLYKLLLDQGSIIAGLLALLSALLTIGAIWSTTKRTIAATEQAAKLTISATKDAAEGQIAAARDQTNVFYKEMRNQFNLMLERDYRSHIRLSWGMSAAMEAAMKIVIEDVAGARGIFAEADEGMATSPTAYRARQRITKVMFPEIREVLARFGSDFPVPFASLENKIDTFAAQWIDADDLRKGIHAGLLGELSGIELEAKELLKVASSGSTGYQKELTPEETKKRGATYRQRDDEAAPKR